MSPGQIRAVARDIDGTLIGSAPLHEGALFEVCRDLGHDLSDLPGDAFKGVHRHDIRTRITPRYSGIDRADRADWAGAIVARHVATLPRPGARSAVMAGLRVIGISPPGGDVPGADVTPATLCGLPALILPWSAAIKRTA